MITQGRQNIEWLSIGRKQMYFLSRGRYNLSLTPYNREATAALKAQFPTQWETIWDYGFAHPEIVGYMNAYAPEDAKIAYSLVPTLGVFRCLVFTGTQYINTGVKLSDVAFKQDAYINLLVQWTSFASNGYQVNGWLSNPQIGISVSGGNAKWQNYARGTQNLTLNAIYDVRLELDAEKSVLKCDGFNDLTSGHNTASNNYPFFVGCMTSNGTSGQNFAKETIGRVIIQGETRLREMYPFIRKINGVDTCGMIDVLSGTFYQNAGSGSFTISETPAA